MSLIIRKAERRKAKLRLGISGPSGSGKTYSSIEVAFGIGGPVGLIDTENGSGDLYAHLGDYDIITLTAPFTVEKYTEAIRLLEEHLGPTGTIIIDSLSHAWSGEGGLLEQKDAASAKGGKGNDWAAWRNISPQHNRLVEAMLQSQCHIIATTRAKSEYVQEKDERGKTVVRKIGMAAIQRDGLEYEFTVFLDIDQDHIAVASKDRTGLLDGKRIRPGRETGRGLLRWLEGGVEAPPPAPKAESPNPTPSTNAPTASPQSSDEDASTAKSSGDDEARHQIPPQPAQPTERQRQAANPPSGDPPPPPDARTEADGRLWKAAKEAADQYGLDAEQLKTGRANILESEYGVRSAKDLTPEQIDRVTELLRQQPDALPISLGIKLADRDIPVENIEDVAGDVLVLQDGRAIHRTTGEILAAATIEEAEQGKDADAFKAANNDLNAALKAAFPGLKAPELKGIAVNIGRGRFGCQTTEQITTAGRQLLAEEINAKRFDTLKLAQTELQPA